MSKEEKRLILREQRSHLSRLRNRGMDEQQGEQFKKREFIKVLWMTQAK
jgi:hypothetical protein